MTENKKVVAVIPITDATPNDKTWPPQDPIRRMVHEVYLADVCVCGEAFTWESLLGARWWPHKEGRIVHAQCWKDSWLHTNPKKVEE